MVTGRVSNIAVCPLHSIMCQCYLLTYALRRTVSNFNIPAEDTLFLKYGSNVRCIIDILKHPELEATYDLDIKRGAINIAKDFSTILLQFEKLDFKSNLSSEILSVRPNNLELRLPVLTIPTAYLFKTLAMAVSCQALAQQHLIFTTLTAHPSLGTAAGWWFEKFAQVTLSDPARSPISTHPQCFKSSLHSC